MQLNSLGYRTDLIFARFDGIVEDLGDAIRIRNPRNPDHYYGNLLVFDRPPRPGDLPEWEQRFAECIGVPPEVKHRLFGWDAPDGTTGEIDEFLEAGYTLDRSVVMTAERLHPPRRPNLEAELRPLRSDEDWALALENQIACREARWDEDSYRPFKERQMRRYREMAEAGRGAWFGAFLDGRVVADMGIFSDGELARYQAVGTHPDYRGRGLCGTLVHFVGEYARRELGVARLVIVADDHYFAKDIYRAVGFEPVEYQASLLRSRSSGE
ncbi:RimJ/RimL family protein N-acetyltransferase [Deinobacterium chartae]|uniref:RimJ/RimL family protein N-acetyltransferase n=1 Tax=Deinobacterium chartae TaxID=521158 RepID=A0A841I2A7_9DEIO|nr:GNAT family N-acetyltransferase [Deinobacterium chartae]MBB6098055.1 RimJ/RimL family protein N-acetyltransferase [Deinobacterium chartae]